MKLLLDECVPRRLKREFSEHEVFTIEEAKLKGLKNGNLLRAADGKFDILITVDKNMQYQQNITGFVFGNNCFIERQQSLSIPFITNSKRVKNIRGD